MSKKVIQIKKPAAKSAQQVPGENSPILKNVSPEQKSYIDSYSPMLGVVLQKIWKSFGKGPFDLNGAIHLEDQLISQCDHFLTTKFKGILNLQEFVMLLGALAGSKAGMAMAQNQHMSTDNFHGAGQLFEASMRIMAESTRQDINQKRAAATIRSLQQVKH